MGLAMFGIVRVAVMVDEDHRQLITAANGLGSKWSVTTATHG